MDMSQRQATEIMDGFNEELAARLEEGETVAVQGFGSFSVKKKLERVVLNPLSKQRMLVPPKIVINFKPSQTLKDKLNDGGGDA